MPNNALLYRRARAEDVAESDLPIVNGHIPLALCLKTPAAIERFEQRQAEACAKCGRNCRTPLVPDCGGMGMTFSDWIEVLRGMRFWRH